MYTCVVCDNPLFKSEQKYDAGCGWPSFHDVMAHGKVTLTKDTSHGMCIEALLFFLLHNFALLCRLRLV